MINPLGAKPRPIASAADVGYFAAIAIASLVIGKWAGIIVFLGLTLAASSMSCGRAGRAPRADRFARRSGENERRILVVANETVGGERLREEIRSRSEGYDEQVLVVCPALNSPLRHWASDEDGARLQAQERLKRAWPGSASRASTQRARSATPSRSRRWRTRSGSSAPTRSSSRRTPRAARTGSRRESSKRPGNVSRSRSRTSSSTSQRKRQAEVQEPT